MATLPNDDTRPALSTRQRAILTFIENYIADHDWAPSIREIGRAVDLNSTSSVAHQLVVLEARGYLRRHEHVARAMAVISA